MMLIEECGGLDLKDDNTELATQLGLHHDHPDQTSDGTSNPLKVEKKFMRKSSPKEKFKDL